MADYYKNAIVRTLEVLDENRPRFIYSFVK